MHPSPTNCLKDQESCCDEYSATFTKEDSKVKNIKIKAPNKYAD